MEKIQVLENQNTNSVLKLFRKHIYTFIQIYFKVYQVTLNTILKYYSCIMVFHDICKCEIWEDSHGWEWGAEGGGFPWMGRGGRRGWIKI